MKDNVFCHNCDEMFEVDYPDYWECEEEQTFLLKKCPKCKEPNAIYFSTSVSFHATKPTEKDLEELRTDLE